MTSRRHMNGRTVIRVAVNPAASHDDRMRAMRLGHELEHDEDFANRFNAAVLLAARGSGETMARGHAGHAEIYDWAAREAARPRLSYSTVKGFEYEAKFRRWDAAMCRGGSAACPPYGM